MAEFRLLISVLSLVIPNLFISGVVSSGAFTLLNKCNHTVWPGILSNAGIAELSTTGFALQKGESKTINAPSNWGGRFWGRTLCAQDSSEKFSCVTGDCGSGKIECAGENAAPPVTLAEFTLDGSGGYDFYDVSLVDGYNLPILVVPQGGTGDNCTSTGCVVELNGSCPSKLKVTASNGEGVACKSACDAFGESQYCCSGAYSTPDTCKPSSYSEVFKKACPRAYSYAYDDKSSTFTCAGAGDYLITFCPSPNTSQKSSSESQSPVLSNAPLAADSTMVYEGAVLGSTSASSSASSTCVHMFRAQFIAGVVFIASVLSYGG